MKARTYINLISLVILLLIPCYALAQEVAGAASLATEITGLSLQQQLYITWASIALKYASEFYSSVRNGGGLRRIVLSFWFGENVPPPIAKDYAQELTQPPK